MELFCFAEPQAAPSYMKSRATDNPIIGIKHFALQVKSLENAKKTLQEQGIEIYTDITKGRTGVSYLFIKDPDGIWIEIIQDDRKL